MAKKKEKKKIIKTPAEEYEQPIIESAVKEGQIPDFIQKQQEYKRTVLARMYRGACIKEIRRQLEKGPIEMQWNGMTYPKHILVMEHEVEQQDYFEIRTKEEQLKNYLLNIGLKPKQIEDIIKRGKLVKELPDKAGRDANYFG